MACPDVEKQEEWFGHLLSSDTTIEFSSGRLTLSDATRRAEFVEQTADPVALLVGPTWVVTSVLSGGTSKPAPTDPTTELVFDDATYKGSTGCYVVTGSWEHHSGLARISGWASSGCEFGTEAEQSPLNGFGARAFVVKDNGDTVQLLSDRGHGVVLKKK